jgi:hypothetical protein
VLGGEWWKYDNNSVLTSDPVCDDGAKGRDHVQVETKKLEKNGN